MTNRQAQRDEAVVRCAEPRDVPAIARIYNHAVENTIATFDTTSKSLDDRRQWLLSRDHRHPVLVLEVSGQVAGWAALSEWSNRKAYADTAETAIYLDPAFHGRGLGRVLETALIEAARELRFHTLIALIADGSDASLGLHRSFGFEKIGTMKEVGRKFGKLIDVHILQKMLSVGDEGSPRRSESSPCA